MKNNLATVAKGAVVGLLISGAAWKTKKIHDKLKFDLIFLENKIEMLYSRLEVQTADVVTTPN